VLQSASPISELSVTSVNVPSPLFFKSSVLAIVGNEQIRKPVAVKVSRGRSLTVAAKVTATQNRNV
jgi:hypothetical protein